MIVRLIGVLGLVVAIGAGTPAVSWAQMDGAASTGIVRLVSSSPEAWPRTHEVRAYDNRWQSWAFELPDYPDSVFRVEVTVSWDCGSGTDSGWRTPGRFQGVGLVAAERESQVGADLLNGFDVNLSPQAVRDDSDFSQRNSEVRQVDASTSTAIFVDKPPGIYYVYLEDAEVMAPRCLPSPRAIYDIKISKLSSQ